MTTLSLKLPSEEDDVLSPSPVHVASYISDNPCKTKIACTIGPSSSDLDLLRQLVSGGVSVIRLNLSHCSHSFASEVVTNLRDHLNSIKATTQVAVLFDLNGTKLRTGRLTLDSVKINSGSKFTFLLQDPDFYGDERGVFANIPYHSVAVGEKILVDDGSLSFTIIEKDPGSQSLICSTDHDGIYAFLSLGELGSRKGVNIMNYVPDLGLAPKDAQDIKFALEQKVDFVTISCIHSDREVKEARKLLGGSSIKLLSKIESRAGLDNFDKILQVSDGIIIDRGYLGVEIDMTKIALVQKDIVQRCQLAGKPIWLANQILESMVDYPKPNRSESSDVTSGVVDGADGLILSAETAIGKYPLESLFWIRKICYEAERHIDYVECQQSIMKLVVKPIPVAESIACSAIKCAREIEASCILVYTELGGTARLLAKYRPSIPVIATTCSLVTARQLSASFGLISFFHPEHKDEEAALNKALFFASEIGVVKKGDPVVICSGTISLFGDGATTIMRVTTF